MDGSKQHPQPRLIGLEKNPSLGGDVARPIVPDQMQAPRPAMVVADLFENGAEMLTIVARQNPTGHLSLIDIQLHQEVDDAMPDILKLLSLDLPRPHRLRHGGAFQGLNVWLLIQTDDPLAAGVQDGDL